MRSSFFLISVVTALVLLGAGAGAAQPGSGAPLGPAKSLPAGGNTDPAAAPAHTEPGNKPGNEVKIEVRDGYRYITSNGIPDHPTGQFPGRGNPNSISAQKYSFRAPEHPKANDKPTSIGNTGTGPPPMLVGVAVNGIVFDPGTAEWWHNDRTSGWNYEALSGKIDLGVDSSHAHVQPNGAYHYHGVPTGLVDRLVKESGAAEGSRMILIGWAADGFPIYSMWGHDTAGDAKSAVRTLKSSYRIKSGERTGDRSPGGKHDGTFVQDYEYVPGLGDLDECNGRTGVTPEFPGGTYYYVITDTYPFIPRLLKGTPDQSFARRGPPGGRRGMGPPGRGRGRPGDGPGRGPRGGPDDSR
jgi:hypothetical protein